jgi:hypothetical protein
LTSEPFWYIALAHLKRLELPQWIQQQTKIQATETTAKADFETFSTNWPTDSFWPQFAPFVITDTNVCSSNHSGQLTCLMADTQHACLIH